MTQAPQPIDHFLANDLPGTIQPNQFLDLPFTTSAASAQVAFQVADRSTTSPDTITTAVVPESEMTYLKNGQPFKSYGGQAGKAPLAGQGVVPAGSYHFVVLCRNAFERCQFSYTVNAVY
jgi:hypothetical protein